VLFSSATRFVRAAASGAPSRYALTALPKPYQPGSSKRHWPHEKPHGIARRSSMAVLRVLQLARGRALPMFSSAISVIGVAAKK
jgi:hypothetical protein